MLGDTVDITGRLRSVLPARWFSDQSPNLDAILTCLATPWAWLYNFIQYVIQQARLATANGQWLDLIAYDFLGASLPRKHDEGDVAYRERIRWALVQEAATRVAISANLQQLTGFIPRVFEPANCADTGAYGNSVVGASGGCLGMAYGLAGGWGSVDLPFQFFIDVKLPVVEGLASLAGYGDGEGGYGVGSIAYVDLALLPGSLTSADIEAAINQSLPFCTTAWLRVD